MRNRHALTCLVPALIAASAAAQPTAPADRELKFTEGYTSSVTRTVNETAFKANATVRDAMKGNVASIPATWRLVNVLPKGSGYVMFFQDQDGSVRSLGMDGNGAVTGGDVLWVRSYR